MRTIHAEEIILAVKELFIDSNYHLPADVRDAIESARYGENNTLACTMLDALLENADIAENDRIPICQDTGMAVIFAEIGQDVHIQGGVFSELCNIGVRQAYDKGYLRKSVVSDPLERKNTGDNTPCVIYTELVAGDRIKLTALPKGFGSENMSRQRMFNPTSSEQDIIDFVVKTVTEAGGNPCPPIIIGIGIGGTFDYSTVLSKKALSRPLGTNTEKHAVLADAILEAVNKTGVGIQGLGVGKTALGVNIETFPTHIASIPVAVNISCHATRHKTVEI